MKRLLLLSLLLWPLLAFSQPQGTAVRALNGFSTNQFMFDAGAVLSMKPGLRRLYDGGGTIFSLEYDARVAYDTVGVGSVLWGARQLNDSAGAASLNWDTRTFSGAWTFPSGSQTPWLSDINGGNFNLTNVNTIIGPLRIDNTSARTNGSYSDATGQIHSNAVGRVRFSGGAITAGTNSPNFNSFQVIDSGTVIVNTNTFLGPTNASAVPGLTFLKLDGGATGATGNVLEYKSNNVTQFSMNTDADIFCGTVTLGASENIVLPTSGQLLWSTRAAIDTPATGSLIFYGNSLATAPLINLFLGPVASTMIMFQQTTSAVPNLKIMSGSSNTANVQVSGSITASNGLAVATNYVAENMIPQQGLIKLVGSNNVMFKVTTTSTNEVPGSVTTTATNTFAGFTKDGGGGTLSVGQVNGAVTMAHGGTITGWSISAGGSSPTCTIDVWKIATGTTLPTVANTIMGTKPALAVGNAVRSSALTGWTATTYAAGDIIIFNIDAVANATWITFALEGYQ